MAFALRSAVVVVLAVATLAGCLEPSLEPGQRVPGQAPNVAISKDEVGSPGTELEFAL